MKGDYIADQMETSHAKDWNRKSITVRATTRVKPDERRYDAFDWQPTSTTKEYFVWGFLKNVNKWYTRNLVWSQGVNVVAVRKKNNLE